MARRRREAKEASDAGARHEHVRLRERPLRSCRLFIIAREGVRVRRSIEGRVDVLLAPSTSGRPPKFMISSNTTLGELRGGHVGRVRLDELRARPLRFGREPPVVPVVLLAHGPLGEVRRRGDDAALLGALDVLPALSLIHISEPTRPY